MMRSGGGREGGPDPGIGDWGQENVELVGWFEAMGLATVA